MNSKCVGVRLLMNKSQWEEMRELLLLVVNLHQCVCVRALARLCLCVVLAVASSFRDKLY